MITKEKVRYLLSYILPIIIVISLFFQTESTSCNQKNIEIYTKISEQNELIIMNLIQENIEWSKGDKSKAGEIEGKWMANSEERYYLKRQIKDCSNWNSFVSWALGLTLILTILQKNCNNKDNNKNPRNY